MTTYHVECYLTDAAGGVWRDDLDVTAESVAQAQTIVRDHAADCWFFWDDAESADLTLHDVEVGGVVAELFIEARNDQR